MKRTYYVLAVIVVALALAGCGGRAAEAVPTLAPTADAAALVGPMQGLMTGMHNLMQQYQGTPMPPEAIEQMQGMMTGMQGLMGQMQGLPGTENMPGMMQQMQGMMSNMQGMMGNMPGMMGATPAAGTPMPMPGMAMGGMMGNAPAIPAGLAYADGQEIRFVHTEVSDPDIAQLLTNMMSSPVLVVPSLAEAPESATAPVYVFTNGPAGMGPLGFQPDVFPFPPGTEGYTPLRRIHLLTWADAAAARELRSAAEVETALAAGELTEEVPGVVVNMPFVTWPGGGR